MLKLILDDENIRLEINTDRDSLSKASDYFEKLLNFGQEQNMNEIVVRVDNAYYAHYVVTEKLYQENHWMHYLNMISHQNFFNMEMNLDKLYELRVPPEGFDLLLKTIEEINIPMNDKLRRMIKRNLPTDYDLDKLSRDFIQELIISKYYLASIRDNNIKIWDGCIKVTTLTHPGVKYIVFSHDGKYLVSESDKMILLWFLFEGNISAPRYRIIYMMEEGDILHQIVYSKDNIIILKINNRIKRLNALTGEKLGDFDGGCGDIILPQNGSLILERCGYETVRIRNIIPAKEADANIMETYEHGEYILTVAFSNDDQLIAIGSEYSSNVKIWNRSTNESVELQDEESYTFGIEFSPNNETIAVKREDGIIKIWNTISGKLISTIKCENRYGNITFCPDNRLVSYDSNSIKIWKIDGELMYIIPTKSTKQIISSGMIQDDTDARLTKYLVCNV